MNTVTHESASGDKIRIEQDEIDSCELKPWRIKCSNADPKNIGSDGKVEVLVPTSFSFDGHPAMEICPYCKHEKDLKTKQCKVQVPPRGKIIRI